MKQLLNCFQHILENGKVKTDRTGTGTISTFGYQMRFNLREAFPMATTKKTFEHSFKGELLWMLSGGTNAYALEKKYGTKIWLEWADKETGELGRIYGKQWRDYRGVDKSGNVIHVDQIKQLIHDIKTNPDSRRLIVTAWNPAELDQMNLPPCHCFYQFYVSDGELSCQLYQRSVDSFLGLSYNIAFYSLLTHLIAHVCDLKVGEFIHTSGDLHIYLDHIDQVKLQLSREPKQLPQVKINPEVKDIFDFTFDDIEIVGYESHPHIKGKVSV
ncbi:thymidylate synthase [Priestia flexa]|uniref:thymidylate synthase n=1 Tax=Priestia flexa TaxID=86664 RepID=UPI000473D6D7|nr:thymidylate synthase [Priestia flexa]